MSRLPSRGASNPWGDPSHFRARLGSRATSRLLLLQELVNVSVEPVLGAPGSVTEQPAVSWATLAGVDHHDVLGEEASIGATEGDAQCASAQGYTTTPIQTRPTIAGLVTAGALAASIAEPHRLLDFVGPQALLPFLKEKRGKPLAQHNVVSYS